MKSNNEQEWDKDLTQEKKAFMDYYSKNSYTRKGKLYRVYNCNKDKEGVR